MSSGLAIFLAAFTFISLVFGMLAVHLWIMHSRRTKGSPLLRVSTGLSLGTRYVLTVPAGVREVDFFLRYQRRSGGGEDIFLRIRGPVSREFKLRLRGVSWAEYRQVLSGVTPGQYEVELAGSSPAEFLELLAVGHPAVAPALAS
jgi:hypothetical protein